MEKKSIWKVLKCTLVQVEAESIVQKVKQRGLCNNAKQGKPNESDPLV